MLVTDIWSGQGRNALGRPGAALTLAAGILLAAASNGCATAPQGPGPPVLAWPEPPEVTRVEFVRAIRGSPDVVAEVPSVWDRILVALGVRSGERGRGFAHPADVEVSPDGSVVYVSDFTQGIIHVLDLGKPETRYIGLESRLDYPFGLAVDSAGNVYVAEQRNRRVVVFDPGGRKIQVISDDRLERPVDVAVDEARRRLYVADGSHQRSPEHYVRVFDLDGSYLGEVGEGRGTDPGFLLFPTYLALDPEGNLFVSDTMNSRISVFDPQGRFVRAIGSRGDGFGLFDKPKGVALDSFGNVYVVDSSWSNVQIFGPEGDVLLYFGGRGSYPGLLRNPTGIAIARATNTIFVGDYLNRRLCVYRLVNTGQGDGMPEEGDRT